LLYPYGNLIAKGNGIMPPKPIYTPEERIIADRASRKRYEIAHAEEVAAYRRKWRRKNRARLNAAKRARRQAEPGKEAAKQRAHRHEHPEKDAQWRENNRLMLRAYQKTWRSRNPEKFQAIAKKAAIKRQTPEGRQADNLRNKAWRQKNLDRDHETQKRRRARKKGAAITDFTPEQWASMKEAYGYRCVYCGRKMKQLTQDHIIPLSQGGNHTYSNIVPACRSCNSKKSVGTVLRPIQPLLLL
jgi:5-methylcytosine-specific restriction endonuclease McrA